MTLTHKTQSNCWKSISLIVIVSLKSHGIHLFAESIFEKVNQKFLYNFFSLKNNFSCFLPTLYVQHAPYQVCRFFFFFFFRDCSDKQHISFSGVYNFVITYTFKFRRAL